MRRSLSRPTDHPGEDVNEQAEFFLERTWKGSLGSGMRGGFTCSCDKAEIVGDSGVVYHCVGDHDGGRLID